MSVVERREEPLAEYPNDPTIFAQRCWYYLMGIGAIRLAKPFATGHEDEPRFLLHYIRRGEMWHRIAERTHRVRPGQACLMYLQKPVRYGNDRGAPLELWWVEFGGHNLSELFLALEADHNPLFDLPDLPRFERIFHELLTTVRDRPPSYQARSYGLLVLLLAELLTARGKGDAPQVDLLHPDDDGAHLSAPVLKAIRYIARYFSKPFKLQQLGVHVNLNAYYLVRQFRQEVGITPMRYLTRYRIEKAKELLQTTTHPICEVARLVGVPDCCTFTRTFHKITQQTPTEYRTRTPQPGAGRSQF